MSLYNDRTLFIPWPRSQAGTFASEHGERDEDGHHDRNWTAVCADDVGKPLAKIGIGRGTRLHVVGHGAIGDPTIGADHGTGGADVSADEIVAMLEAKGLKKYYMGTIACDVCYSALGNPSFAKTLAKSLWSAGYRATCTLGYKGPLYSTYEKSALAGFANSKLGGAKFGHRTVMVTGKDGVETLTKSKYAQTRFFGFV